MANILLLQERGFSREEVDLFINDNQLLLSGDLRFAELLSKDFKKNFSVFLFVRDPLSFWQSFWCYRMWQGWESRHEVDSLCEDNNFNGFIEKVLLNKPGWFSTIIKKFHSNIPDERLHIGKFESLRSDLKAILLACGETFDEKYLDESLPIYSTRLGFPYLIIAATRVLSITTVRSLNNAMRNCLRNGMDFAWECS